MNSLSQSTHRTRRHRSLQISTLTDDFWGANRKDLKQRTQSRETREQGMAT
jgi:hypothetical protein